MRGGSERGSGGGNDGPLRRREGLISITLTAIGRALEAEQDRWFLWLPVVFAGGIIGYFGLHDEPGSRLAIPTRVIVGSCA